MRSPRPGAEACEGVLAPSRGRAPKPLLADSHGGFVTRAGRVPPAVSPNAPEGSGNGRSSAVPDKSDLYGTYFF